MILAQILLTFSCFATSTVPQLPYVSLMHTLGVLTLSSICSEIWICQV